MIKLLIAVDGSDSSLWAVRHAAFLYREGSVSQIVLLNVQAPMAHGRACAYHSVARLREQERKQGEAALARATEILDDSGVDYVAQIGVGSTANTILNAAQVCQCDGIVLGVSAWSRVLALAGAGTPARIMRRSRVPVTLVNAPHAQIPSEFTVQPRTSQVRPELVVYSSAFQPQCVDRLARNEPTHPGLLARRSP